MTVAGRSDPRVDRARPGRRRHPRHLRQRQPPRRPDRGAPRRRRRGSAARCTTCARNPTARSAPPARWPLLRAERPDLTEPVARHERRPDGRVRAGALLGFHEAQRGGRDGGHAALPARGARSASWNERRAGGRVTGIPEKPTFALDINAAVYAVPPEALDLVQPGVPSTMPDLVQACLDRGHAGRRRGPSAVGLDRRRHADRPRPSEGTRVSDDHPGRNAFAGSTVLVTGADGFIGSHVVERVARGGRDGARPSASTTRTARPAGWTSPSRSRQRAGRRPAELVLGDIRDPELVDAAVDGVDVVLHLAALIAIPYSYVAPRSYVDTNVTGTLNVLEAVRRHDVPRMVQHVDVGGLRHARARPDHRGAPAARPVAVQRDQDRRRQAVRGVRPARSGRRW